MSACFLYSNSDTGISVVTYSLFKQVLFFACMNLKQAQQIKNGET